MCVSCGCHSHTVSIDGRSLSPMGSHRRINVNTSLLAANDQQAQRNRSRLAQRGIYALNLLSSPGSGKTSILVRTLEEMRNEVPIAVIEGDQQTRLDAERIANTGTPVVQVNTGQGCHLDALMIDRALNELPLQDGGLLFIENVGNLVCPASFDLGEARKVIVLSTTEGEDKPLKYPDIFAASHLMLLNKCDLLSYLEFEPEVAEQHARLVQPNIDTLRLSARTGEGFDAWLAWLRAGLR